VADAKKDIEEVGVAERLANEEAHPSQTDASKPAPEKPKAEKVTAQQASKDKGE